MLAAADIEFDSEVVSCTEVTSNEKKKGNSNKGPSYSVILKETQFREEAGGQLEDEGTV